LAKADNDLLNIANNLSSSRVPWDTVCYHAQQVAEKALKACLVARGLAPPKTHDLPTLLRLCQEAGSAMEELEDDCRLLVRFGAAARYPGEELEPSKEDGLQAVEAAKRVKARVMSLLDVDR
jgi:HEPN domain-containing protein